MKILVAVGLLCCARAILGEQLPYPLQLFYLTPNNVGIIPPYQADNSYMNMAVDKMKMTGAKTSAVLTKQAVGNEEVVEGEASQFHSQDTRGRALFGYTTPDQARIEARSEDGKVRGSYSYLDAWGKAVKVQYWDDGTGFHAAGNNLPSVYADVPQPVQDTPEVTAAKEQHFQLFQQALAAALASSTDQKEPSIQKPQQTPPEQDHDQEGVIVESDDPGSIADDDLKELTRYPNLQMFPQNLYDPTQVHDANREAVIVDNPDIAPDTFGNSLRSAKTLQVKTGAPTPAVQSLSGDVVQAPHVPGGFFYSFRYPVPLYVQVRTVEDGKKDDQPKKESVPPPVGISVSQKAALFGAIPVAAVHDAQVPPYLRNSIKNYQVMPLYVETGMK